MGCFEVQFQYTVSTLSHFRYSFNTHISGTVSTQTFQAQFQYTFQAQTSPHTFQHTVSTQSSKSFKKQIINLKQNYTTQIFRFFNAHVVLITRFQHSHCVQGPRSHRGERQRIGTTMRIDLIDGRAVNRVNTTEDKSATDVTLFLKFAITVSGCTFWSTISTHIFQVQFQHTHISGTVLTHIFQAQFQHKHFKHIFNTHIPGAVSKRTHFKYSFKTHTFQIQCQHTFQQKKKQHVTLVAKQFFR